MITSQPASPSASGTEEAEIFLPRRCSAIVAYLLGAAALAMALPVSADEMPGFDLHGFGTLGLARSNTDRVHFVRDLSQPDGATDRWTGRVDTILGLQANARFSPQFEGVVQGVSRYRHDGTFTPEISWAYVKYDPNPRWSLRAGRLGTEFFMLADSRQVGYSYLTVRPPGDYFWSLPFQHIDGLDVALTVPADGGLLRTKVFAGVSTEKMPLADRTWKLDGSLMAGAYADFQRGSWQARLAYARIHFNDNLPTDDLLAALRATGVPAAQAAARALTAADSHSDYYSVGLVYDDGPWQAQLMLNRVEHSSQSFQNANAGYLLGARRLGACTPYIGYSWVQSRSRQLSTGLPDVGLLAVLNAGVAQVLADGHAHQHTAFLGARWDFAANMALKVQWDRIRGEPDSIFPYRREKPDWNGRLDIFSLTLDFVF